MTPGLPMPVRDFQPTFLQLQDKALIKLVLLEQLSHEIADSCLNWCLTIFINDEQKFN